MNILMPDPHPGRCLNFRYDTTAHTTKRCLDYEGHDGRCRFPDPYVPPARTRDTSGAAWQVKQPEPWVSPLGPDDA